MNVHNTALSDQLAAEYVLGTLQGAARWRFEQLLLAHPNLQRAVSEWESRLNRLATTTPPETPPPDVWRKLEKRLFPTAPNRSWWGNLVLWRGLAAASILVAVIALTTQLALPPSNTEMSFAAIRGQQQKVLWTIAVADGNRLHVNNLQTMEIPPNQQCFLWLKTDNKPAVLLGALPDDGSTRTLVLPTDASQLAQSSLWVTMQAISSEPAPPPRPLYKTHWQTL